MERFAPETTGVVFDIEEFAVYDGPGIRCCVFLKGCPLHCMWCHNPEGLSPRPQRCVTRSLCVHCGACDAVCPSPGHCTACGKCAAVCPKGAIRIAGKTMTAMDVARRLDRLTPLLQKNGGGVTFSGGEVLMQPEFTVAVRRLVPKLHALIETSGFAPAQTFQTVAQEMNMVIMDVKLTDCQRHRKYTGVDNAPILQNLAWLKQSGIPFRIRVPLIPGVNDDPENLRATANLIAGAGNLEKVELLPYNKAAGAKYDGLGMRYAPDFDETRMPNADTSIFSDMGIPVEVL